MSKEKDLIKGINNYIKRLEECKKIYIEILNSIPSDTNTSIYKIKNKTIFNKVIKNFVTALDQKKAQEDLMDIYDIAIHTKTKSLIIANKGASLYSISEKFETPHIVKHIGMCVYVPGMGMEYANVGIIGNVYDNNIVLRTESACTPSFLFGSQRCNCYYQWKNVRELAAYFNKVETPNINNGLHFEKWVQSQYIYNNGKHIYQAKSKLGFVLVHVDSQNGMGSGYTKNEFVFNLSERASMRHRGEYTAEQTFQKTMAGGFEAIGINPDPRSDNNNLGYQITPIILDYLDVNKNIIVLTNNSLKIEQLKKYGYTIHRIKSIGAINIAGRTEAKQRGEEFHHLDIKGENVEFKEDYERIKNELKELV